MSNVTVANVPHVHGKSLLLMCELMEFVSSEGLCRKEKLCIARYLPGLDALGTNERGEVWNGPSSASSCACVKGPT